MRNTAVKTTDVTEQIVKIGLEKVALILQTTPKKLKAKIDRPELFEIKDLIVLQEELGFTDKMILLMLDKLKRED